jgi:Family of unknown function (DUF6318)
VELVLPYGVEHCPRWARHQKGLGVSIRRSVAATIAAAVVATGALSGCGDDEGEPADSGLPAESELTDSAPEISPGTADPTPSDPTPSGPPEPPLPAAAKAPGRAGAKAFVAYYIELLNYASWTGDTDALRKQDSNCRGCMDYVRLFESTYKNGGWFKDGAWSPNSRTWFIEASGNGFFVAVTVDAAKGLQCPRRSAEVTRFLADRYRLNFLLSRDGDEWQMKRLGTP